ncbi:MAG: hypothetical protein ACHQT9_00685 [Candidatus Saccharimonadales bacterium]
MDTLKRYSSNVKSFISNIYRKPKIFLTLNISGLIVSFVGILICFVIIGSSVYVNTVVNTKTVKIQTALDTKIDSVSNVLSFINSSLSSVVSSQIVTSAVNSIATRNINRLNAVTNSLETFNFNNRLQPTINNLNNAKNSLESIKNFPSTVKEGGFTFPRVKKLEQKLTDAKNKIDSSARNVRLGTLYGVYALILMSLIFILGEINLLARCFYNVRSRLKKSKPSKPKKTKK